MNLPQLLSLRKFKHQSIFWHLNVILLLKMSLLLSAQGFAFLKNLCAYKNLTINYVKNKLKTPKPDLCDSQVKSQVGWLFCELYA